MLRSKPHSQQLSTATTKLLNYFVAANFLRAVQLWYPVEIIFMASKGMSVQHIFWLSSFRGILSVVAEIPTGSLADIWGLKKTLILASFAMMLCSMTYVLVPNEFGFYIATSFWTLSLSLANGTRESYVHFLLGKDATPQLFSKWYGKMNAYALWGIAAASAIGGYLAFNWSLTGVFVLSALLPAVSLYFVFSLPEHVASQSVSIGYKAVMREHWQHATSALSDIVSTRATRRVLVGMMINASTIFTFAQVRQLQYARAHIPDTSVGLMDASRFVVAGFGSKYAGRHLFTKKWAVVLLSLVSAGGLGLALVERQYAVIGVFVSAFSVSLVNILLRARLQALVTPKTRAASNSAVNMLSNLLFSTVMFGVSLIPGISLIAGIITVLIVLFVIFVLSEVWYTVKP
jgi:MFS family permease